MLTSQIERFQRYIMPFMKSNMYVFTKGKSALIIDPHPSMSMQRDLLTQGIREATVFLTHEHFDHTSGVRDLRKLIPSLQVIAHEKTAETLRISRNNRPLALLKMIQPNNREEILSYYRSFEVEQIFVDTICRDEDVFFWNGIEIQVACCPGHSPGSVVLHASTDMVFTGDYMIEGESVILRYPGGSLQEYEEQTLPHLLGIGEDCLICPGHGEPSRKRDLVYEDMTFRRRDGNKMR